LDAYRDTISPYAGAARGRWPIQVDPDDIARVYFRDPGTRAWHVLAWEHAPTAEMPLSEDALAYARRLARASYTYPDDKIAVADLLARWNAGLGNTRAERRMALRASRERSALIARPEPSETPIAELPSVAKALAGAEAGDHEAEGPDPEGGDDDAADVGDLEDFYADALEDV
jgi:hypothetical protein